jgi:peptidyl-prolyl cis-trans isomerase D
VRDAYRKQNIKIKFDYAVISSDDLSKSINPSDGDLAAFIKKNAARYATAVPEERKIAYFAFHARLSCRAERRGPASRRFSSTTTRTSPITQCRNRPVRATFSSPCPPAPTPRPTPRPRPRRRDILKQLQGGANFAALASKFSDDPGSKDKGGELGFAKRGAMVPAFDNAIFTQKIGDFAMVKSQFGYHIVQVEERQPAHTQALGEVEPAIQAALVRQKAAKAEQDYAQALTSEAIKNGLGKTAAAHHLAVATTPLLGEQGVISALADSSQILAKAFASKQGDPPQFASTGEGYAIFQVTGIAPAHAPNLAEYKSKICRRLPQ